ncbi:MAG: hypothetical protein Edafosvirus9_14 [Edafosvirus sp.]|uniref:Uncharacterized protein n=1 Tax=Edafosvirus sp. TaxID=2487765 RepID=A0A3G4ZTS3_9VIRU|nr:MAG: hypothetical protein Edafosvirus9_14 [Edafosvirus sp.]
MSAFGLVIHLIILWNYMVSVYESAIKQLKVIPVWKWSPVLLLVAVISLLHTMTPNFILYHCIVPRYEF